MGEEISGDSQRDHLAGLNRAILESALDCIIIMDAKGRVLEFNPAAERVFGYARAEAVGRELAELIIPPALRERHRRGLQHYLETGEGPVLGKRIEIAAVRCDGTEILVELAITASRVEDTPLFTAYLRDITERVRTERRRTTQYTVASLLAGSWTIGEVGPQILQTIATSGDWRFGTIWLRDEAKASLGCEALWHDESLDLSRFADFTRVHRIADSAGLPGQAVTQRKAIWITDVTREKTFPRSAVAAEVGLRGGFAFPLSAEGKVIGALDLFSANPVTPDEDFLHMVEALGSQIGLFIHREQIEAELQQQKEAAETANVVKDRFLATLSHELRTPLTPVLMWAGGMVQEPGLTAEVQEGLEMVVRNVELEAKLIDDLLDLTRITRGRLQLHPREADVHDLVRHAMDIVQGDLTPRQLTLALHLDAAAHRAVVDPPRMQQVFWNVLRNAYKFTPDHGTVRVRSSNPEPGKLMVEFSDSGVGIETDALTKIFDAFEQVGTRPEGLGLGLAISRAIVEMHGGTIAAHSDGIGKGTTVSISLPLRPELSQP